MLSENLKSESTKSGKEYSFYACYLLFSFAPKAKNVVYVGSTPDPPRRLRQHNGEIKGGAKRTAKSRPWEMAIIVYGFPNKFSALQFEWSWQKPHRSRHLKNSGFTGAYKERFLETKLKVLAKLFTVNQYRRWPLHIHFTMEEIYKQFVSIGELPTHIKITRGSLKTIEILKDPLCDNANPDVEGDSCTCSICSEEVEIENIGDWLCCIRSTCPMLAHMVCLSKSFLQNEPTRNLIPLQGQCPTCFADLKWGDLIKALKFRKNSLNESPSKKTKQTLPTPKRDQTKLDPHITSDLLSGSPTNSSISISSISDAESSIDLIDGVPLRILQNSQSPVKVVTSQLDGLNLLKKSAYHG